MRLRWRILFGLLILVIVFFLLRSIDFIELWYLIDEADNSLLFMAFLSYFFGFIVFNIRSMYISRKVVKLGFWFSFQTMLAGFFANNVTPGPQVGGDPVRAHFIGLKYGKSKSKVFGAILADRFFHLTASLFFTIASLLFVITYVPVSIEFKIIFQTLLFAVLIFFSFIAYFSFRKSNFDIEFFLDKIRGIFPGQKPRNRKSQLEKILIEHFGHFAKTFRRVIKDKKMIFFGTTLSIIHWILNFASSYFLFLSLGSEVSFLVVVVVFNIGNLIGYLSPIPGGIGLVEGASIITYTLLGIPLAMAIAVSLLTRIIFYFFSLFLGGLSLVHLEHTVE